MKKFTIIGLAVCLAFALAAPATAVDVDFSGHYYVRGSYVSHWDLDDRSASNAYMDMQFRLKTVFKVNDILSVTTRFDALDEKVWGDGDETTATTTGARTIPGPPWNTTYTTNVNNDIDFDRAYMTIKAPIGTFFIGRQIQGVWGTSFIDTEDEADRIKYVKKIDNLKIIAIFQKNAENDNAPGLAQTFGGDQADQDSETYYLAGIYKMENTTAGLLTAFANDKTIASATKHTYVAMPYFISKFGPLAIQGELRYNWGETSYDTGAAGLGAYVAAGGLGATQVDIDIKQLAYNLEATYNFGPASVMAGYAFVSGDSDGGADDEVSAFPGVGDDWGKLFILTTTDVGVLATGLGGFGNLSDPRPFGAKILYGGVNFSPLDNLELGVVVGHADADEIVTPMTKDDYGLEYDFTLNWKIYDNLTYSAVAAFLEAGDIWWGGAPGTTEPGTFEDTYALFHQLELSF